jgi:hypothetical protein
LAAGFSVLELHEDKKLIWGWIRFFGSKKSDNASIRKKGNSHTYILIWVISLACFFVTAILLYKFSLFPLF